MPCQTCEIANGLQDAVDAAMAVRIDANAGTAELSLQSGLRPIDNDEIWTQRKNPLGIRIEQRSDARERFRLGREVVIAADADHLRSGADREQHFRDIRDERDDPASWSAARAPWRRGLIADRCARSFTRT